MEESNKQNNAVICTVSDEWIPKGGVPTSAPNQQFRINNTVFKRRCASDDKHCWIRVKFQKLTAVSQLRVVSNSKFVEVYLVLDDTVQYVETVRCNSLPADSSMVTTLKFLGNYTLTAQTTELHMKFLSIKCSSNELQLEIDRLELSLGEYNAPTTVDFDTKKNHTVSSGPSASIMMAMMMASLQTQQPHQSSTKVGPLNVFSDKDLSNNSTTPTPAHVLHSQHSDISSIPDTPEVGVAKFLTTDVEDTALPTSNGSTISDNVDASSGPLSAIVQTLTDTIVLKVDRLLDVKLEPIIKRLDTLDKCVARLSIRDNVDGNITTY